MTSRPPLSVSGLATVLRALSLRQGQRGLTDLRQGQRGLTDLRQGQRGLTDLRQGQRGLTDLRQGQRGLTDLRQGQRGLTDLRQRQRGLTDLRQGQRGLTYLRQRQRALTVCGVGEESRTALTVEIIYRETDHDTLTHPHSRQSPDSQTEGDIAGPATAATAVCRHVSRGSRWGSRLTLTFPLAKTASKVRQLCTRRGQDHGSSLRQRQCHTQASQAAGQGKAAKQHQGAGSARRKQRIPLSYPEEIEEVVAEYPEVIAQFAAVLGCSEAAMRDMVRRDTRLLTQFDKEAVMAKMRLLLDHGFSAPEILSRYQVFTRSLPHMQSRLQAMEVSRRYQHSLAILLLSQRHFHARMATLRKEAAIIGDHSSQASFVAQLLECSEEEVKTLATEQFEFLLTLAPSRLQDIVSVVRSFGLSAEDVRSQCLMLRCPPDVARLRLQRAIDAGVFDKDLVCYALTNSHAHFEASFASWVDNARALGPHANERELLMHMLECSEEDVLSLMRRKGSIAKLKSAKIKRCLDILQKEVGLSSHTILGQGELLYSSPRRLRARWALLEPLDLSEPERVRELLLTERKFVAKYGHGSDWRET